MSERHNRHYPMFATKHALPARKETCNPSTRKLSPLCANYKFVNWQVDPSRAVPDCLRGGKNDNDVYNHFWYARSIYRDRYRYNIRSYRDNPSPPTIINLSNQQNRFAKGERQFDRF